jgi:hypothetical protein
VGVFSTTLSAVRRRSARSRPHGRAAKKWFWFTAVASTSPPPWPCVESRRSHTPACVSYRVGAHVFVGLVLLSFANIRSWRGHFGPKAKDHLGVEVPGIYWHFVDVMWIIVYTTVYIL